MPNSKATKKSSYRTWSFAPRTSSFAKRTTTRLVISRRIWQKCQLATKDSSGREVDAWVLALYYAGGMSEPKILELLQTVGMHISAGQISDLLIKDQEQFHAESAAVVRAGLASSPWQHLDSTGTRVNGKNEQCHVLCNPFYTAYSTLPSKDRLSLLRVLMGGADPNFRLNETSLDPFTAVGRVAEVVQEAE